jgi:hypothetical protein
MAKAKIGIKYCGGCNPMYERVEMIQEVQSLAKKRFLFLGHDQQGLDGVIAVNGCPRVCAVKDLKPEEVPYYSIAGKDDLSSLMEWLFILEQNENKR